MKCPSPARGGILSARLDHTVVHSRDRFSSARFLTELLGAPEPTPFGPFVSVPLANGVTLDYADATGEHYGDKEAPIVSQHLAFLVDDEEFDTILERIKEREIPYWADPFSEKPQQINHAHQGRGFYFRDPNDHFLEFMTHTHVVD
ncbi:VOC family protein [Streptomyces sp. NPDC021093]|uniref:VOC family protein n=1 Tax=Streptomyces sp. NPDC021093 TaxID=3365112 RepID=UPI00379967C7